MRQFTVRLDGVLESEFEEIKKDLGLKIDNEVVRSLIREEHRRRFQKPSS
jgi:hypothetical protein